MSTAVVLLGALLTATVGHAHELQPAVADIRITHDTARLEIELSLEPIILGIDLNGLENTDDASESALYDALRMLPPEALRAEFDQTWPGIASKFRVRSGGALLPLNVIDVDIPKVEDESLARLSTLYLTASLPDGDSALSVGWAAELGNLIVRHIDPDGDVLYAVMLTSGADSKPMTRGEPVALSLGETLLHYVVVGIEHIIPKGLDHILFVLGLFFFALAVRPLLIQVTVFTLAHTVTLALATLGYVTVPASVVEPLIALSIAYVAIENLRGSKITRVRIAVVFGFGLLHGLGFAYVLGDIGLASSQFIASLVAFNVGVELGQLSVLVLAFVFIGLPFGKRPWYRKWIAVPASVAIAAVGLYWTVERVFF